MVAWYTSTMLVPHSERGQALCEATLFYKIIIFFFPYKHVVHLSGSLKFNWIVFLRSGVLFLVPGKQATCFLSFNMITWIVHIMPSRRLQEQGSFKIKSRLSYQTTILTKVMWDTLAEHTASIIDRFSHGNKRSLGQILPSPSPHAKCPTHFGQDCSF